SFLNYPSLNHLSPNYPLPGYQPLNYQQFNCQPVNFQPAYWPIPTGSIPLSPAPFAVSGPPGFVTATHFGPQPTQQLNPYGNGFAAHAFAQTFPAAPAAPIEATEQPKPRAHARAG